MNSEERDSFCDSDTGHSTPVIVNNAEGLGQQNKTTKHSITSLQKISLAIISSLENFFYWWGFTVATNPLKFITGCILITLICGTGLYKFEIETRPDKLVIPQNSELAVNTEWLKANFPLPVRRSFAIIAADNVLTPEVMHVLMDIHEAVKKIRLKDGKTWNDVCFRLPITKFDLSRRRRKRSTSASSPDYEKTFDDGAFSDDFFTDDDSFFSNEAENFTSPITSNFSDPTLKLSNNLYCSILEELDKACWEVNPAELWSFNREKINNLTRDEIIQAFNHLTISPIFGRALNYKAELGGKIVKNSQGEIIQAESLLLTWTVGVNETAIRAGLGATDHTGQILDKFCLEWEREWTELMKTFSGALPQGIDLYFVNSLSWGDINEATIMRISIKFVFGLVIMFVYVGIMMGRFNMVEQRPVLTISGLLSILFAIIISCGLGTICNVAFGTLDKIMPFLLLGIGIDDMFVIKQSWNNLYPPSTGLIKKHPMSIPERMAVTLKHAGVSITVTSLTDVTAFAVGASTILPCLRSFCIYAVIGIIATFIFQATFFVAMFALDQKRLEDRRNAYFCCIKYTQEEFKPKTYGGKGYVQEFFDEVLSKYLLRKPVRISVILLTCGFLAIGVYGNTQLKQEFDPLWFLPEDSYMVQFLYKREANYPGIGYPGVLAAHNVNWTANFNAFDKFSHEFKHSGKIYRYESWYEDFKAYSNENFHTDIPKRQLTDKEFKKYMGRFLYSAIGSKYRFFMKFDGEIKCGEPIPRIKTVLMPFRFIKFNGSEQHVPAIKELKELTKSVDLSYDTGYHSDGNFFIWSTAAIAWETDAIIQGEMYRNLSLSLGTVLVAILILLANVKVCLFCGLCVIFTVIDAGGVMYFWGLTIDTVTVTMIILAVGLCVDYAAHIGLAFMQTTGTKVGRATASLKNIGPAVFNGGFSTFLGVILVANAEAVAIRSFFKIFTLVVFFGLFHGLIFLPVLLSLFGPDPYSFATTREKDCRLETDEEGDAQLNNKIVEMHTISNGILHEKEIHPFEKLNNDLKQNGIFKNPVEDPLLLQLP